MAELPSGTVSFLITDMVGATRLLDRHRDAAVTALDRHENLLREVVQAHAAVVFTAAGDNFGSVFNCALNAVEPAIDLQRRQRVECVDEVGPLSVRMAIHSGVAHPYLGGYRSPNTYRAFRLAALARGGQVLIAQSAQELLGDAVARASACALWANTVSRT